MGYDRRCYISKKSQLPFLVGELALRLGVWLFAQNDFHLDRIDLGYFLAFRTVQWEVDQDSVHADFSVRPASAFWTGNPLQIN